MKTYELKCVLMRWFDEATVCPVHMLDLTKPGIYIANTDYGAGHHWVALYVTEDTVEFFLFKWKTP